MNYTALIRSLSSSILLEEQKVPALDELDIQSRWFSGLFGETFKSNDGCKVKVKQFGFWNRSAGPDFLHCAVEIDGVLHTGPIELDLSVQHWYQHGHDTNAAFDPTVLHVVCSSDSKARFTRTLSNRNIPVITLSPSAILKALGQDTTQSRLAIPGRCSTPIAHLNLQQIDAALWQIVRHRCRQKTQKMKLLEAAQGSEQAVWVRLAETLGYKNNRAAFASIAHRIPIRELKAFQKEDILAILFGVAGFLHPNLHEKAPTKSQQWIESLWQRWWTLRQQFEFRPNCLPKWQLSGTRPVNHPQRRLAALAVLAAHWPPPEQENYTSLKEYLKNLRDPFWERHYTLTSNQSKQKLSLLGNSRIDDYLINHLLPDGVEANHQPAIQLYQNLPAPVASDKVRRAADRLLGGNQHKKHFLSKAWHHQAMIQVYDDFCLGHLEGCSGCPFPKQMITWANSHVEQHAKATNG